MNNRSIQLIIKLASHLRARAQPLFTNAVARSVFVWTLINNHPIGNNRKEGSCAPGADLSITPRVANRRELTGLRFRATPREEAVRRRVEWAWPGVRGSEREREPVGENKRMRGEAGSARRALFPWIVLEREFAVWHDYTHQNRTKSDCTRYKEHKLQKGRRHPRVGTLRGTVSWHQHNFGTKVNLKVLGTGLVPKRPDLYFCRML